MSGPSVMLILRRALPVGLVWLGFVSGAGPSQAEEATGRAPRAAARAASVTLGVLGGDGGRMAGVLVARLTPPCREFRTPEEVAAESNRLRALVLARTGLEPARAPFEGKIQRTLELDDYRIEVVRLEVWPGLYLPANVYLPTKVAPAEAPLVILPTTCGQSTGTPGVQTLAGNPAKRGMVVVVTEGFCGNGARASLPDANPNVG